jgi:hypothetical protein
VIAERLRLDARELKWHVARLKGAAQTGNLQISFPFYAQRAVVTYYFMTRRLLDLYQAVNFSMLAKLQEALLARLFQTAHGCKPAPGRKLTGPVEWPQS